LDGSSSDTRRDGRLVRSAARPLALSEYPDLIIQIISGFATAAPVGSVSGTRFVYLSTPSGNVVVSVSDWEKLSEITTFLSNSPYLKDTDRLLLQVRSEIKRRFEV
jgi:hypothetical protein